MTDVTDARDDVASNGRPLSIRSQIILDAGKRLVDDTIVVVRDYCKTMIGVALTSLGLYLGILSLLSKSLNVPMPYVALTCSAFFGSTVLFILALFPKAISFDPTFIEESLRAIEAVIRKRKRWGGVATAAYLLGIVSAVLTVLARL